MNEISKDKNCLNLIRLLAAFQVMYGHVRMHLSISTYPIIDTIVNFFNGVPVFFAMSGFLIWFSVGKSKDIVSFYRKRFWRIYPELWLGVVAEAIALLVFYTRIDIKQFALFLIGQATIFQFWTPDSLRDYGCGTPNGSLWTICVLIQFYIIVWGIYKLLHKKSIVRWIVAITGAVLIGICLDGFLEIYFPQLIYKLYCQTVVPYMWIFLTGAVIAELASVMIPLLKKYWVVILAVAASFYILGYDVYAVRYGVLNSILLFAALIGFAYKYPQLNVKTDISYGLYIYHMTVVNVMITLGLTQKPVYIGVAFGISAIAALISTKTIGKIALKRKNNLGLQT